MKNSRGGKTTCKYYETCGSCENCKNCEGYTKKKKTIHVNNNKL